MTRFSDFLTRSSRICIESGDKIWSRFEEGAIKIYPDLDNQSICSGISNVKGPPKKIRSSKSLNQDLGPGTKTKKN